jgi:pyruvate kinase
VPLVQKRLLALAGRRAKPTITATQMLESMVHASRPTRAEVADVANAIFDGTDAVMLSAETASGKYPREAVAMMARIIVEAESNIEVVPRRRQHRLLSISETICESVAHAAQDLDMKAIAVYTQSGTTARLISKYRPQVPIFAFAATPAVCERLNLLWGVQPVDCQMGITTEEMAANAERMLLARHALQPGDVMAIVAGTRTAASGSTNFMRLHVVGSAEQPGSVNAGRIERRKVPREKRRG